MPHPGILGLLGLLPPPHLMKGVQRGYDHVLKTPISPHHRYQSDQMTGMHPQPEIQQNQPFSAFSTSHLYLTYHTTQTHRKLRFYNC